MEKELIESIVRDVLGNLENDDSISKKSSTKSGGLTDKDYPLAKKQADLVKTPSGKKLDDLKLQKFISGEMDGSELRITAETLYHQAEIARSVGREQFAKNLERAAELTKVDDDRILEIYNAMRPYRSTKAELIEIAEELENNYDAVINANLIREAADVYEKRERLKGDR
ncbi:MULTISPECIES: diol dehydratase small subunit [Halanaerobium]|jgi:propanediol dehydratase small subunit|uniref:Propanediol dehydratase small subunit n=1 Tax=Halanaerobium congolense TaxID=54121 RepID=A0A1G6L4E9_9FIRM|nr:MULTISPECIES: diol dehydratase small subunit [Halanaerobium]PUU86807.1 MAG: propanediol dehydratase small subunit [Halanaerobium sp.]SDC37991.1 propanediol dehydratase small subunit [Halanaerobium congolense]